jgi:hypothetical protein
MKVVEEERNKGLKPKRGVKLEEGREYEPAGFAPLPRRRVVELRQMILGKYFDRATFGVWNVDTVTFSVRLTDSLLSSSIPYSAT